MWSEEKKPQRNPREWSALRPFKPLTQLVTGLIPRSNFDNVAGRSGTPEPALIGRAFAFTILTASTIARPAGSLGTVTLKFGAPSTNDAPAAAPAP